MQILIGPGPCEVKILSHDGRDITKDLHITEIKIGLRAQEAPEAVLFCELFPGVSGVNVQICEENVRATLRSAGVPDENISREES